MALEIANMNFDNLPAHAQMKEDDPLMNSKIGMSNTPPILVLDNGQFLLKKGGQAIQQFTGEFVDVILHAIPEDNGKLAYKEKWVRGAPPVDPWCWSLDSNKPHESVPANQKMSEDCSMCAWSVPGSAGEGDYKKCGSTTQILISTLGEPETLLRFMVNGSTAFGEQQPAEMKLSFNGYVDFLRAKGMDMTKVLTRIWIDRTPGANNKSLFQPLMILEPTDVCFNAHENISKAHDLKKLIIPAHVIMKMSPQLSHEATAALPNAADQAQASAAQAQAAAALSQPAPVAVTQPAPVAAQPAPVAQVAEVPAAAPMAAPAAELPVTAVIAPDPAPVQAEAVTVTPADVGQIDAASLVDADALASLATSAGVPDASQVNSEPVQQAAIPEQPAAVADPAVQPAATPASTVTAQEVSPDVQAAVAGMENIDLSSMLPGG